MVYAASATDVRATIVDGEVLMEDGRVATIDADEVRDLVDRETAHLLTKAGLFGA
jgi:5-methylthioadenosine/S-adenosylhomocysteine deaminase